MNNLKILQDNIKILEEINALLNEVNLYQIYNILKNDINIKEPFFYGELEHFFNCDSKFDDIIENLNNFYNYLKDNTKILELEYLKLLTPHNNGIMENELEAKDLKTIDYLKNEIIKNDYNYILKSLKNVNTELLAYKINYDLDLLSIYKFEYNNFNLLCTYELCKIKKYKLKYVNIK